MKSLVPDANRAFDEDDPVRRACSVMEAANLRLTRQRCQLAKLIFTPPFQHVSADSLAQKARAAKLSISLATIYNSLAAFSNIGLLKQIPIAGEKVFYDTNIEAHQHYFVEDRQELIDIPTSTVDFAAFATPLPDYMVTRVDVVVRLKRKPVATGAPSAGGTAAKRTISVNWS